MNFTQLVQPIVPLSVLLALGCTVTSVPQSRPSGQSELMSDTYAGKNACNPENQDRPFIVEWDATDMSSFEHYAASDIVIVKYQGCSLKILDECRNDSVHGSQGAYQPPEWTTGQLETIDIQNEGDLYTKLPLGEATLGGRVTAGEKFHMEYYVAGTRQASRPSVYRADLADNPGCEGATHFVYAYNLGAFALGSAKELGATADGSVFGFGAGGTQTNKSRIDKKGGDLSVCKSESAREIEGCKAPIRLALRKVREGRDPSETALEAADTAASLNAAGQVNEKVEMSAEARSHLDAAQAKITAGDGQSCLVELNAHDSLDPTHESTDPKSDSATTRAHCLMMSGQCDAGKMLARKSLENSTIRMAPEQIDSAVEAYAMQWCQGKMSDRDALLQALFHLRSAAFQTTKDVAFCQANYDLAKKLKAKVPPKDDDDRQIIDVDIALYTTAPVCMQRAGDCEKARKIFDDAMPPKFIETITDPKEKERTTQHYFESTVRKCAKK